MTIYTSTFPSLPPVEANVFTTTFPPRSSLALSKRAVSDVISGHSIARGELIRLSRELAWGIRNKLRLNRGVTSMIYSPNTIAYPIILLALQAAGVRTTLASAACTIEDLAFQYSHSDASLIFVHPPLLSGVLQMFSRMNVDSESIRRRIILVGYNLQDKGPNGFMQLEDFLGLGHLNQEENFDGIRSHETALLCYSSGTSGKPKGVEITHRNMSTAMKFIQSIANYTAEDVLICIPPYSHIYGCVNLLLAIYRGTELLVMPGFNPATLYQTIQDHNVTIALMVPPILVALAQDPAVDRYSFTSLRRIVSAAAPLSESLSDEVRQRLQRMGADIHITQAYGLTETSPVISLMPTECSTKNPSSVGFLLPNLEMRLVDDKEQDVPIGSQGEIWVRGPIVMKGYLKNTAATKEAITSDGFFKTGDIGSIDEKGLLYIKGRKKELIKYKGYQVAPAELESILLQHPDIKDCAVVGINSAAQATELPRAYVVPARKVLSEDREEFCSSVQQWIKLRVAHYKYLRGGVFIINEIPRNAGGKILRRELMNRVDGMPNEGVSKPKL